MSDTSSSRSRAVSVPLSTNDSPDSMMMVLDVIDVGSSTFLPAAVVPAPNCRVLPARYSTRLGAAKNLYRSTEPAATKLTPSR